MRLPRLTDYAFFERFEVRLPASGAVCRNRRRLMRLVNVIDLIARMRVNVAQEFNL
jgi:hypothetical protein